MPKGGIPEAVLSKTLNREFWKRPISVWSIDEWDKFFSKNNNTNYTEQASHDALKAELNVLILNLKQGSRASRKANLLFNAKTNKQKQVESSTHNKVLQNEQVPEPVIKKLKLSEREEDSDDNEQLLYTEINKLIARYNIIFLPESNKNDVIRITFKSEEWRNLEDAFSKIEDNIMSKISPSLKKVENVLNEYQDSLKKATDEGFVNLDSVFIVHNFQTGYKFQRDWLAKWVDNVYQRFLTCFQLSRNVLNSEASSEYQYRSWIVNLLVEDLFLDISSVIRLDTGEIENKQRKTQRELSKLPEERRPVGWFHDGILTININGIDEYVGILEVNGNAVNEDHVKLIKDREKVLKAMRLALFHLEATLRNNGVDDEQQLKQELETFGIQVDRRDFSFYAMHHYNGAYLVDEIDLSFVIPNTPMPLFLLEEIIQKLLKFRTRVEHLNMRIIELLKCTSSRRRPRRQTTAVDVTPRSNTQKKSN